MGLLSWTFFWPNLNSKTRIFFHIYRHLLFIISIQLATLLFPSVFMWIAFLLSLIEYTRSVSNKSIFALFLTTLYSLYVRNKFLLHLEVDLSMNAIIYDLLKVIIYFIPLIFDRLTVKRFGVASSLSAFAFPILLSGSLEILTSIDRFGLFAHISSFCADLPEINVLIGPTGYIMFIGLVVSYISQRHHSRVVPYSLTSIHVRIIIVVLIIAYSVNFFISRSSNLLTICQINDISTDYKEQLRGDINIIVPLLEDFSFNTFISLASATNSIIAFHFNGYLDNKKTVGHILTVVTPSGHLQSRSIKPFKKKLNPFRFLKDMLTVDTEYGTIGFIIDHEMLKPEYFTSKDVTILVTFGGDKKMEEYKIPYFTRKTVSLMTGATRIHASEYSTSFAVDPRGKKLYAYNNTQIAELSKIQEISIAKNYLRMNGIRFLIADYVVLVAYIYIIVINILPMRKVQNLPFLHNVQ